MNKHTSAQHKLYNVNKPIIMHLLSKKFIVVIKVGQNKKE